MRSNGQLWGTPFTNQRRLLCRSVVHNSIFYCSIGSECRLCCFVKGCEPGTTSRYDLGVCAVRCRITNVGQILCTYSELTLGSNVCDTTDDFRLNSAKCIAHRSRCSSLSGVFLQIEVLTVSSRISPCSNVLDALGLRTCIVDIGLNNGHKFEVRRGSEHRGRRECKYDITGIASSTSGLLSLLPEVSNSTRDTGISSACRIFTVIGSAGSNRTDSVCGSGSIFALDNVHQEVALGVSIEVSFITIVLVSARCSGSSSTSLCSNCISTGKNLFAGAYRSGIVCRRRTCSISALGARHGSIGYTICTTPKRAVQVLAEANGNIALSVHGHIADTDKVDALSKSAELLALERELRHVRLPDLVVMHIILCVGVIVLDDGCICSTCYGYRSSCLQRSYFAFKLL